ncbi:MAG: hypothetical protein VKL42_21930 [Snowella sp.]|nr:hypothetical protein [Snowella sp.]
MVRSIGLLSEAKIWVTLSQNARQENVVAPQNDDMISITETLSPLPNHRYVEISFEQNFSHY